LDVLFVPYSMQKKCFILGNYCCYSRLLCGELEFHLAEFNVLNMLFGVAKGVRTTLSKVLEKKKN
jgi:hypothetical protein